MKLGQWTRTLGCAAMITMLATLAGCGSQSPAGSTEDAPIDTTRQALSPGQAAGVGSVAWEYVCNTPAKPGDPLTVLGTQFDYVALKGRLKDIAGHNVALDVQVPSVLINVMPGMDPNNPARNSPWTAIDEAVNVQHIPVILWLTLPEMDSQTFAKYTGSSPTDPHTDGKFSTTGYFANVTNAGEYTNKLNALRTVFEQRYAGKKAAFLLDLELRKDVMGLYGTKMKDPSFAGDLAKQTAFFQKYGNLSGGPNQTVNRVVEYNTGLATYKTWVNQTRAAGWKVYGSSFVQMLDDYADGDASLRRAYGIPLDDPRSGGTVYDRMYFQAYTTFYGASLPGLTNYFVYSYARTAKSIWGAATGIDVGLTDGGIDRTAPLYWSWIPLAQDVSAALGAGIARDNIEVYSLFGMNPIDQWLIGNPGASIPPGDVQTPTFRAANTAADAYFPAQ